MQARLPIVIALLITTGALVWVATRHDSAPHASIAASVTAAHTIDPIEPAMPAPSEPVAEPTASGYAVDLEDLRRQLPNNRYWELGAPTQDPAIARLRAERARRTNELFGRTQTGEASPDEIRGYYAEQRRISEDYLQLSLVVLAQKASELPDRDRGLFELSVNLHRARLVQIDRDLADALARRAARP